jgi:hypothetical protein
VNDLPGRILAIYDALAARPGGTVRLADLRERLGAVDKDDLDRTLIEMDDNRQIQLEPDPDRRGLTSHDHAAAVSFSGRAMHLMRAVRR